jgi:predicted TIM-barrel fold metal-dependent hydrolase
LPIFEAASSLRIPLFIHPQIPQKAVRDIYYSGFGEQVDLAFATFGLGWHYESGIQFLRLILAGVFDRFPDLQIILGHWGEVVLFYTGRLSALNRVAKLQRSVVDYMRQNLYVTPSGMFCQSYLQRSIEAGGIDRILFSTDYPYQYRPEGGARSFLGEASLSDESKRKIAHLNWEGLSAQASFYEQFREENQQLFPVNPRPHANFRLAKPNRKILKLRPFQNFPQSAPTLAHPAPTPS